MILEDVIVDWIVVIITERYYSKYFIYVVLTDCDKIREFIHIPT